MTRGEDRPIQRDFNEWKASEDQFLRDWGGVYDLNELSARLDRPRDRVKWRMENVLGLVVDGRVRHKVGTVNMGEELGRVEGKVRG